MAGSTVSDDVAFRCHAPCLPLPRTLPSAATHLAFRCQQGRPEQHEGVGLAVLPRHRRRRLPRVIVPPGQEVQQRAVEVQRFLLGRRKARLERGAQLEWGRLGR